jgi:hypothetical protein
MSETKNIYQKLLEVKKKVPYIKYNAQSFGYSYANPSAVLGKINPILNEIGLFLKTEVIDVKATRCLVKTKPDKAKTTKDNTSTLEKGEKHFIDVYETLYDLNMRYTWVDTETGETDVNLFFASGMNGDEKGVGSAMTYAERYFLLKTFNIPTDSDDPDSFVSRHESEEDKAKREAVELAKSVKIDVDKLSKCETKEDVKKIWSEIVNKGNEEVKELISKFK